MRPYFVILKIAKNKKSILKTALILRLREWDVNTFGDINAAANLFSRSYSCLYLLSPLEGPLSSPQEFQAGVLTPMRLS